jgi:hypothetical protein
MAAAISWLMLLLIYAMVYLLIKALSHQKRRRPERFIDPNAPVIGASGSVIG